jgi:hypothetical protein
MTPIAARIARVHTGSSVATLIHAIDDDGREHRLEFPPALARTIVPGQVLVFQWSVHTVPDLSTPEPPRPAATPADPIDHEFDLRNDPPAAATGARDIIDEFHKLLGSTREKG